MFFGNNLKDVDHCFFSRLGGNSIDIYNSLNCGSGSKDKKKDIKINRLIVSDYFSLKSNQLCTLHQTHSNRVTILDKHNPNKTYIYDGIVTKQKNIILGILTADCAPILFYDNKKRIAGACHAGWKGAFTGIISNTIDAMISIGSSKKDISCSIGPCIGSNSYEVMNDFFNNIIAANTHDGIYFNKIKSDRYLFDLKSFIVDRLKSKGIVDISSINLDTYSNDMLFYSYRRSVHKKEDDYGRMISTIVIKD